MCPVTGQGACFCHVPGSPYILQDRLSTQIQDIVLQTYIPTHSVRTSVCERVSVMSTCTYYNNNNNNNLPQGNLRLTAANLDGLKVPFWSKKAFIAWQQKQAGDSM